MDVHVYLRTGAMRNGAMPASMPRRSLTRMLLRRQECDMLMRHSYALAYATSLRDNRACARFADVGRRPATVRRPIASTPLQPFPPLYVPLCFNLCHRLHLTLCTCPCVYVRAKTGLRIAWPSSCPTSGLGLLCLQELSRTSFCSCESLLCALGRVFCVLL